MFVAQTPASALVFNHSSELCILVYIIYDLVINVKQNQTDFLDFCEDPGKKEDDFPLLKQLEEQWMVSLGSLGSLDPVQGCNRRDDAKAKARTNGI